jgi:hypothetical protein
VSNFGKHFDIQSGPEEFDYVHGGARKRLERIYAVKLSNVTEDKIESWIVETL